MSNTGHGSGKAPGRVTRFAPFVMVSAVLLLGACSDSDGKVGGAATASEGGVQPVEVISADKRFFKLVVEYPATVTANKRAILVSKLPGEVVRVNVSEGDRVTEGQVLVELDPVDILIGLRQAVAQRSAAQAGVEMAEANLLNIQKNFERMSSLHDKGTVAERDFDQIDAGYKVAKAQVRVARAQLLIAEAAVNAARTNLGFMSIRAPFDGMIVSRMVDQGARTSAMPPTPLLQIVDADSVKLVGGVPERAIPAVLPGADAKVFVDALSFEPIPAKVDRVEPLVDPRTRTAIVRVIVANGDGKLLDGMSARVEIDTTGTEAPAVPEDAVSRSEIDPAKGTVFIVKDGQAHRVDVLLGSREGDIVEVVSGLSGGESVIRGSQSRLVEGQAVQVKTGQGE